MPKVSVIIPCYNQGQYLAEAVDSVLSQTLQDLEIVVVNDGSTDEATITLLEGFGRPRTRIIHTTNNGLAAARNNGIAQANAPYILPLDADDTIGARYLQLAAEILDTKSDVGIVYSLAEKFGSATGAWKLPDFTPAGMCIENSIFCSALYRKRDWEAVGGYDPSMKYGWEDWDLWLSLVERGRGVFQIPEVLFSYRTTPQSMTKTMTFRMKLMMFTQLFRNHPRYFSQHAFFILRYHLISRKRQPL